MQLPFSNCCLCTAHRSGLWYHLQLLLKLYLNQFHLLANAEGEIRRVKYPRASASHTLQLFYVNFCIRPELTTGAISVHKLIHICILILNKHIPMSIYCPTWFTFPLTYLLSCCVFSMLCETAGLSEILFT